MDLRGKSLSNPLLQSSLLSSPSLSKLKTSSSLRSTENRLLETSSVNLLLPKRKKKGEKSSGVKSTKTNENVIKRSQIENPLLLQPSLVTQQLKRKSTPILSPSSSVDGTYRPLSLLSDDLVAQKTSSSKKRLITSSSKDTHHLLSSLGHHISASHGGGRSAPTRGLVAGQDEKRGIPYWERTISLPSSEFAFPEYNFSKIGDEGAPSREVGMFDRLQFQEDEEKMELESSLILQKKKQDFINSVSASLIGQADFHDQKNTNRIAIMTAALEIIGFDPEFILKIALYTRKELNIRTTANFLLALASYRKECRQFLKKYFQKSVALPSDWIEVAEIYQTFHDDTISFGALPAALRKAMTAKFPDFDKYQLAKYNKDKKKTDKKKKENDAATERKMEDEEDEREEVDKEDIEKRSFNLKELIRKLHITEPVEHVMCLIGKKYPSELEAFYKSRLPGTWDPERAGKRMKLPTPETWETQVSAKGNKAETWETLIDNKKLPFMAMLRNLRNMISAGISPKHHAWVIRKLTDEGAVVNSKQFPFRFFSAYKVLEDMEEELKKAEVVAETTDWSASSRGRGRGRGRGRQRGRGRGRGTEFWRKKKSERMPSDFKYDDNLLKRYRKALDTAVKIATTYNVKPIRGRTVILCSVTDAMWSNCTNARGLGKPKTVLEVGVLMGLMCKYSCEDCTFILCDKDSTKEVELEQGTILDNMDSVIKLAESMSSGLSSYKSMNNIFSEVIRNHGQVDTFVILSDSWMKGSSGADDLLKCISMYRHLLNRNMLFVNIALKSSTLGVSTNDSDANHENDIYIAGFSDQILRFIAERGDTGQINHVENIDKAYSLMNIQTEKRVESKAVSVKINEGPPIQRWRTVRVFISSTFKDMHGERDLLTRYVFPELRARARRLLLNVVEVDLRWGVTEEQTRNNKNIEVCLSEVDHCDYFIGILGYRYGFIPETYPVISGEEFDWLSSYPDGRSITELEFKQATMKENYRERAFFFMRDSALLAEIPKQWRKTFAAESEATCLKLSNLRERIRSSGCEVFNNYPCYWGGLVDGKPITAGLEEFGERVLNNLWTSLSRDFDNQISQSDFLEEEDKSHLALLQSYLSVFVGRKAQMAKGTEQMRREKKPVFLLTGQQGCGKSAFLAAVSYQYFLEHPDQEGMLHFVGASPGSNQLCNLLKKICWKIKLTFDLFMYVPEDYKNLVTKLPKFLEQASLLSEGKKFFIVIDGLDHLEPANQAQNMEWLPHDIPENVVFVLSCTENRECHKSLQRRSDVSVFTLGPLDILDKSEVVRKMLGTYRKTLDESPFNNQMKLVVSKRHANMAMYLSLACEEIRMFGVFEELSTRLRALSHTMEALLQDVVARLEREHGEKMVCQALVLLVCARDGLGAEELHHLLSLGYHVKNTKVSYKDVRELKLYPHEFIPAAIYSRLVRSIRGLVNPGVEHSSGLRVHNELVSRAITHRYLKGTGADMRIQMHILLAGFFSKIADPLGGQTFENAQLRGLTELPYHLTQAGLFEDLQSLLCNLYYIRACSKLGIASALPEAFQVAGKIANPSRTIQKELEKFTTSPTVQVYSRFVSRSMHLIGQCPSLVWQEAANQPSESLVCQDASCLIEDDQRLVRWKNKTSVDHPCIRTLTGFVEPVSCVDVSPDNRFFVCGSEDGSVKLYELSTGQEVKSFYGHSDAISGVCFAGKDRLVSSSRDGRLSLWDVRQGHRISQMTGHRRQVSWCRADVNGTMIGSTSWDCTVRIWDGRTGNAVCTLTERRPLSCIDFHSGGRKIVTASWDATLKIWDTVEKKRLAILRGHKSSVRSVAWSPNDVYLASASMDGAVMMWSADSGVVVGCLSGHTQPINQLRFAPSGRELVTVSDDHSIKVWSGTLGKQVCSKSVPDSSPATACAFSPDGARLLIGYHNGTVSVLDIATNQSQFEVQHHESRVTGVAWCHAGQEVTGVVVGYQSGEVEILSKNDGARFTGIKTAHLPVMSVAYSPKTRQVAAAYENSTVVIWRLEPLTKRMNQPELLCTLYAESAAPVTCVSFSPDSSHLAAVTRDKMLLVWVTSSTSSLQAGQTQPIVKLYGCHKDWITSVAWSDNGDHLVTGSSDCSLKLWSLKKKEVKLTLQGHAAAVTSVSFSHGCIISSSADGQVKIWSHRGVEITTLHAHERGINCCDILVPSEQDGDEEDEDDPVEEMEASGNWATMVAKEEWKEEHKKKKAERKSKVNLEEVMVASAGDDGTCQIWKPLQGNELSTLTGHGDRVVAVAMSGDGQVVSSSLDKTVRVWKPVHSGQSALSVHKAAVTAVEASPSGSVILTTSWDGTACLWLRDSSDSTSTGLTKVHRWKVFNCPVNCAAFINDKRIVFGSNDGVLSSWVVENIQTKQALSVMKKQDNTLKCMGRGWDAPPRPVSQMSFDGQYLHVRSWDLSETVEGLSKGKWFQAKKQSKETKILYEVPEDIDSAAVVCSMTRQEERPRGLCRIRAYGMEDGSIYYTEDVNPKVKIIKQVHGDKVTAVCVVADHILTASLDAKIKLWTRNTSTEGNPDLVQVGQFNCQAPVSSMNATLLAADEGTKISIVCGDQLGQVYILEF